MTATQRAAAVVETGLARLVREDFAALRGRSVAVLTHPAAILPEATHAVDALPADGVDVRAQGLLAGLDAEQIIELWQADAAAFRHSREGALMY